MDGCAAQREVGRRHATWPGVASTRRPPTGQPVAVSLGTVLTAIVTPFDDRGAEPPLPTATAATTPPMARETAMPMPTFRRFTAGLPSRPRDEADFAR